MITRAEFLATSILGSTVVPVLAKAKQPSHVCDHIAWVERCLRQIQTIKPNMTRSQLLGIFKTEGGWSTRSRRTYVSQDCPYFKVDVEFTAVDDPSSNVQSPARLDEGSLDVIAKISRPYLEFTIGD